MQLPERPAERRSLMSAIKLYPNDTVALATTNLKKGDTVTIDGESIVLLHDIPSAHKIALKDFAEGEDVIKYDNIIGHTTAPIQKGDWIHDHNLTTSLDSSKGYTYNFNPVSIYPGKSDKTFMGYDRGAYGAGIRNHLAVISTVFCANGPMGKLAQMAKLKYPASEFFDGVISFDQQFGCSQTGHDLENTCRIVAGIAKNANFGGVLLVSNGCEVACPDVLEEYLGDYDKNRIKVLTLQTVEDEYEEGMKLIDEIMAEVKKDRRTPINVGRLHIAMNCGGSDGYSGITANTMLGTFCDTMVKDGATMNMTEVPEMMGAEHILMNRAADETVFQDVVDMMNNYYQYFIKGGEDVSHNATQGNHAGGLSTLEEKSLGCIQKGGHCAVMEVVPYGSRTTKNGFALIVGPGNDLAGISAQVAAGAVLTIFTTGRGTPCGFASPVFRIASNSAIAARKPHWNDFNAGRLLDAKTPEETEALNQELYDAIMATVNGTYRTCTEKNGFYMLGALKDGVTL